MSISKVAVIGAGLMGSGIAAQIANAGVPVLLLDIVPKDADDRSIIAKSAIQKMLKTNPEPLMHKRNARLITPGNLEDDIQKIGDCDWIVEVVLEDITIKHQTYEKIKKHRRKDSIVSSNTSTIPLAKLVEGQSDEFKKDFMITHFFNPPRYMRLMEIITGETTRQDAVETVSKFCDISLGKGVVHCKDTPGFIVNRLLVYWMQTAINEAIDMNVPIEVADAVMGKPIGIPRTAVFGLIDLVGVDLMPYLSKSLLANLPDDDAYRDIARDFPFVHQMIEAGYTGRKGKGGFFRLNPDATKGSKEKQVLELKADTFDENQYRKADKPSMTSVSAGKKGIRAVMESADDGGRYARKVLLQLLSYAASLVPQIADNVYDVDRAMQMGGNWKKGPFGMIDDIGPAWLAAELEKEGMNVPDLLNKIGDGTFYKIDNGVLHYFGTGGQYHAIERGEGVILLEDIKRASEPVAKNSGASLWDIGDGVLCFEHTTKMNTFDEQVFDMLNKAIKLIGDGKGDWKALVVYNEASHFSAGANLGLALFMMNIAMYPQVEEFIAGGQVAFTKLKHAPFPVVSAPSGMALGGGCEILLHSDAVQAHAETYVGLVEVGVGVIPGWGGCKEMILRLREREREQNEKLRDGKNVWFSPVNDPMSAVRRAFEIIGTATVAKSAAQAIDIGYFRDSDGVTMNRDRLLFDAKQKALKLAKDYQPPETIEDIRMPGPTGKMALDMAVADLNKSGKATDYDVVVSDHLARVLSGGDTDWTEPVNENDLLKLELQQFSALIRNEGTMARIEHMLDTGKPLRN